MSEEENKLIVFETVEKLTLQNPIGSTVKKNQESYIRNIHFFEGFQNVRIRNSFEVLYR